MPFISTKVTKEITKEKEEALKAELGKAIALIGKGEAYLMLGFEGNCRLWLGGKNDDEKVKNLIKAIDALKERVGIKKTIKEYGVDEKDFLNRLDEMCEQAFDDQCTGANPRYPLISEIKEMYLKCYYGK